MLRGAADSRASKPAARAADAGTRTGGRIAAGPKTTISGCIQSAPAPAGEPAAAAAASKFELASAKVLSGAPVGTSGATSTAMRYRLEGDEKTITPHLNHQVEITGTVSPATAAGSCGGSNAEGRVSENGRGQVLGVVC